MSCRTLIVDDEPLARKRLARFLRSMNDVTIAGECGDGRSAVAMIRAVKPDLVFLDVQMPQMSGFEVVREIGTSSVPVIVFVTAFEEFALRAFEAQALDYILKPFREERVRQAIDRALTYMQGCNAATLEGKLDRLLSSLSDDASASAGHLLVKSEGRVLFLKPAEIDWVEAVGDYVKLHGAAGGHMIRATMSQMEKKLTGIGFARIHRSRLVNLDRVKELRLLFHGESIVLLKNGTRLAASRGCLKELQQRLA